jgi:hypothetical protein
MFQKLRSALRKKAKQETSPLATFRFLYLRNGSTNSEESFIDSQAFQTIKDVNERGIPDAAKWIANRYNDGENWEVEIVQAISRLKRTGGDNVGKKKI